MRRIKKLEIVVDTVETRHLLRVLDAAGVSGYTVIRDAAGKGERGVRAADQPSDVLKNSYVVTACEEDLVPAVVAGVRPILKRSGGICLVSDCEWVIH